MSRKESEMYISFPKSKQCVEKPNSIENGGEPKLPLEAITNVSVFSD